MERLSTCTKHSSAKQRGTIIEAAFESNQVTLLQAFSNATSSSEVLRNIQYRTEMGNSVSCFDPVREHPPYSWPKDHPGRDAAIAEKKRQRRQQKIAVLKGNPSAVPMEPAKEPAKDVQDKVEQECPLRGTPKDLESSKEKNEINGNVGNGEAAATDGESDVKETQEGKKEPIEPTESETPQQSNWDPILSPESIRAHRSEGLASCESEHGPMQAIETAEIVKHIDDKSGNRHEVLPASSTQEVETLEKVNDVDHKSVAGEELRTSSINETSTYTDSDKNVERGLEMDLSVSPNAFDDLQNSQNGKVREEDIAPSAEDYHHVTAWDASGESALVTENLADKGMAISANVSGDLSRGEDATHPWEAFGDRRAVFERTMNELPEAKELSRDVHDPVTGDSIALAEYRGRQMARSEGLVKERVEQYEDVVDERAKELAEQAAIDAVRTEVIERHQWRFKSRDRTEEPSESAKEDGNKMSR